MSCWEQEAGKCFNPLILALDIKHNPICGLRIYYSFVNYALGSDHRAYCLYCTPRTLLSVLLLYSLSPPFSRCVPSLPLLSKAWLSSLFTPLLHPSWRPCCFPLKGNKLAFKAFAASQNFRAIKWSETETSFPSLPPQVKAIPRTLSCKSS